MKALFHAFFASIPCEWYTNNDIARYEGYYASVFYSYFAALGLDITVEDSTSHGRLDMAVRFNGNVYLFEFKVVELAGEGAAMAQLVARGYAEKYRGARERPSTWWRWSSAGTPAAWWRSRSREVEPAARGGEWTFNDDPSTRDHSSDAPGCGHSPEEGEVLGRRRSCGVPCAGTTTTRTSTRPATYRVGDRRSCTPRSVSQPDERPRPVKRTEGGRLEPSTIRYKSQDQSCQNEPALQNPRLARSGHLREVFICRRRGSRPRPRTGARPFHGGARRGRTAGRPASRIPRPPGRRRALSRLPPSRRLPRSPALRARASCGAPRGSAPGAGPRCRQTPRAKRWGAIEAPVRWRRVGDVQLHARILALRAHWQSRNRPGGSTPRTPAKGAKGPRGKSQSSVLATRNPTWSFR